MEVTLEFMDMPNIEDFVCVLLVNEYEVSMEKELSKVRLHIRSRAEYSLYNTVTICRKKTPFVHYSETAMSLLKAGKAICLNISPEYYYIKERDLNE